MLEKKVFYDVVYNPNETNFLKKGKELGNISENGKLMLYFPLRSLNFGMV